MLDSITPSLAFLTILGIGFVYILGTSFLSALGMGDDTDADAHDGDSATGHDTISIFSPKIIAIFMVGFGGTGFIATHYGVGLALATLSGLGSGAALGALALFGLRLLHSQQASSEIRTSDAVGLPAIVLVAIPTVGHGEVGVSVKGQYLTYSASSRGVAFPRNTTVRVQAAEGSNLIVNQL
jgi:membrane protein implicated in regulation of membrane protease activity